MHTLITCATCHKETTNHKRLNVNGTTHVDVCAECHADGAKSIQAYNAMYAKNADQ